MGVLKKQTRRDWHQLAEVPAGYVRDLADKHNGPFDLAELFFGTIEVDQNGGVTHLYRDGHWFGIFDNWVSLSSSSPEWKVTTNTDSGPLGQMWDVIPKGKPNMSFDDYTRSIEEVVCKFQIHNQIGELEPIDARD